MMNLDDMYSFLKNYIDKIYSLKKEEIKQLFIDYKTKEVGENIANIKNVGDNINAIKTTNDNINNITKVGTNIESVKTTASSIGNVNTVSNSIDNINTTANNINNVNTVANIKDNINNVANDKSNIDTVSSNISNVNKVAGSISNVNITAGSIENVNTYAKTYLGAKDSDPTTRNDGSNLQVGDLYFNTTINKMKVYNSDGVWQLASSAVNGIKKTQLFIADGITKEFNVEGGFDATYADIYLNGVNVTKDVDVSDGQNIKFNIEPNNGDEIYGVFYGSFQIADTLPSNSDGTTTGDITFSNKNKGVILLDRSKTDDDGNPIKYRLFIDDGNLGIEEL